MFYKIIERARNRWLESNTCTVKQDIQYMVNRGKLRDSQIEAIKTYLFLKIAGNNRPLAKLFAEGFFNTLNTENLEVSVETRNYLNRHPAALSLFECASAQNDGGEVIAPKIIETIKRTPEAIDYKMVFYNVFYNCDYADYIFSLPMGAGKTYLMAIFIYLDLYYAQNEMENPAFAHNFIIFAPSGLKSSVIPSLRTIRDFDPTWVLPDPAATELKKKINFEVLDESKSAKKSNRTKNPNVQKIAMHQPINELFGFVAVTNAEKVIISKTKVDNTGILTSLFPESDEEFERKIAKLDFPEQEKAKKERAEYKQANELRNLIGRIPSLSIFIDEVHHASAAQDEIKLRAVVNNWTETGRINNVLGFSGTPYLDSAEKIAVTDDITFKSSEISNIVYYYPLVDGIGNFLKRPVVKTVSRLTSDKISEQGIKDFLREYKDKVYSNGTIAKIAIYCGTIEKLEEVIYPLAARIVEEQGMNPSEAILKYHKGNKVYPAPVDAQLQFELLDKPLSKIRIVLLVQIGKEGWDCQSLTGVILSQEGDCPKNMVLQTACRCLRQVGKDRGSNALIYLNDFNSSKLNEQLKKQHHIDVTQFMAGSGGKNKQLTRYNRIKKLKLPPIDCYQLKVSTIITIDDEHNDIAGKLHAVLKDEKVHKDSAIVRTGTFTGNGLGQSSISREDNNEILLEETSYITFNQWKYHIIKNSFGNLCIQDLQPYEEVLRDIFATITRQTESGITIFDKNYNIEVVSANVYKSFIPRRYAEVKEELIPYDAKLLKIENFKPSITVDINKLHLMVPDEKETEKVVQDDAKKKVDAKVIDAIKVMEETGNHKVAKSMKEAMLPNPIYQKTYQYLPYRTDSNLEVEFFNNILREEIIKESDLEIYYNGDCNLTDFRIKCYKVVASSKQYLGNYTPDFLIVQRKEKKIRKVLVIETKGSLYANEPKFRDKKEFMEDYFVPKNNAEFGYKKFDYLYLQDDRGIDNLVDKAIDRIKEFFKEDD